jgi:hypothetical protein
MVSPAGAQEKYTMASAQRIIKTRWGVNLNEITLHEGNVPGAVAYTVTSQRTGEVRTFGDRPEAEKYFDEEVDRVRGAKGPSTNN